MATCVCDIFLNTQAQRLCYPSTFIY